MYLNSGFNFDFNFNADVGARLARLLPPAAPAPEPEPQSDGPTYQPLPAPDVTARAPLILRSIDWGGVNNVIPGDNIIRVYFAKPGESFGGNTSLGWSASEKAQAMLAFQQFENIIDVDVVETTRRNRADLTLVTDTLAPGLLGFFGPPGEPDAGVGVFSVGGAGWDAGGLAQGGYGFVTLIHEFGHGFGLAHPHDTGGGSLIMRGVSSPFGDFGDFDLNQGVFTTMSYNDGWQSVAGASPSDDYGYQGTLMALDIAMLQLKYGANTTFASGDDVYLLKSVNAAGTMYSCIWDTGGADVIQYTGPRDCFIDLRAATINYTALGGGSPSVVFTRAGGLFFGGFTIAQNVLIENGTGGAGDDSIVGNSAANSLTGRGGDDSLYTGGGDDTLFGGFGENTFFFDVLDETNIAEVRDFDEGTITAAVDVIDLSSIDADTTTGRLQHFTFAGVGGYSGTPGEILLTVDSATIVRVHLDVDGDAVDDMQFLLKGWAGGPIYFTGESLDGGGGLLSGPVGYVL